MSWDESVTHLLLIMWQHMQHDINNKGCISNFSNVHEMMLWNLIISCNWQQQSDAANGGDDNLSQFILCWSFRSHSIDLNCKLGIVLRFRKLLPVVYPRFHRGAINASFRNCESQMIITKPNVKYNNCEYIEDNANTPATVFIILHK